MGVKRASRPWGGLALLTAASLLCAACSTPNTDSVTRASVNRSGIDPAREALALREVKALQAKGARVWCVPFARNASGISIYGDARTWWGQAREAAYTRGHTPIVGAVMTFKPTHRIPLGHVAVVSKIISSREIEVDQANWHRNKVSLNMAVVDVSKNNDWTAVRVESNPGAFGSVYPILGFISPPAPPPMPPMRMRSHDDGSTLMASKDDNGIAVTRGAMGDYEPLR